MIKTQQLRFSSTLKKHLMGHRNLGIKESSTSSTSKFLGFSMDSKLTFVSATDHTIKKANSRFNIIKIRKSTLHRSTINQNFCLRFTEAWLDPFSNIFTFLC